MAGLPPPSPLARPLQRVGKPRTNKGLLEFSRFLEITKSLGPDFQGLPTESLARLHRDYLRTREGWGLDKDVLVAMSEIPSDKPNEKPTISPVADPRSWTYKRRPLGKISVRKPRFPDLSTTESAPADLNPIKVTGHIHIAQPVTVRMDRTNAPIYSAASTLGGKKVFVQLRKGQGLFQANILEAMTNVEHQLEINALDVAYTALGFSWEKWLKQNIGCKDGDGGGYYVQAAVTKLSNHAPR
jgi:hypothetical protein